MTTERNSPPSHARAWRWRLAQWLEIRWWRRYLRRRDLAAYLTQKKAYWRRLLRTLSVDIPVGARVLDAGCGPAGVFLVLDQAAVDAVDPLLDQYQRQFAFPRRAHFPWVHFHDAPLEAWRPSHRYDWVCCLNAINHVRDWELALDRLSELALPEGQLLLGVDVHRWRPFRWLFRRLPGDVLHPHQHRAADYQRALERRGWRIRRTHIWKSGLIFSYWLLVAQRAPDHDA